MIRWFHLCAALCLIAAPISSPIHGAGAAARAYLPGAARSKPSPPSLRLSVQPPQIKVGRDVQLVIRVSNTAGKAVSGALVTITGVNRPAVGSTRGGIVTLVVHAGTVGKALVQVSRTGYAPLTARIPIVPGPPATVAAVKAGVSVVVPKAKPVHGRVGTDLLDQYHALTGAGQYASLALRDGTLVDLSANTDVAIRDPLHLTLTGGELFLEVVHGAASHNVQVGTAVASTKGTRLDVRVDRKTKAIVVTVIEGRVQVTNRKSTVLVGAGRQTVVPRNGPPGPPQQADLSAILAWIKNVPNTTAATVPPVLNLPNPPPARVTLPPTRLPSTMTATNPAQSTWTGVVSVPGSIDVPAGSSLTIRPGTVVQMAGGAGLNVQGTLLAQGTAAAPIIFTSAADRPKPGDWQYIALDQPSASGSRLDFVQMFYGSWTGGDDGMLSVTGGAAPIIRNSVFAQATQIGVWSDDNSRPIISDCVFASDGGAAISVPAEGAGLTTGTRLGLGQRGIEVRDSAITHDTVWHRQDAPFVLDGATINPGAALTIEPGSVIRMAQGAALNDQGKLLAQGTAVAPIIVTSNAANPAPGDWQDFAIDGPAASGSRLNYVQMFYGSWNGGDIGMLSVTRGATPEIGNSVFAQATRHGVWADNTSRPTLSNCVYAGDPSSAISVPADDGALIAGTTLGPGQAGIELRATAITHGGTWHRQSAPFILDGGVLDAQVSLTVEPGTLLEMADGSAFLVQGTLLALGTAAAPIIVTSNAGSPAPGNWRYFAIDGPAASGSRIDYVQMFFGSWNGGDHGMLSITGGAAPVISHSVFTQAARNGLWADDTSRPTLSDCIFAGDASSAISVPADDGTVIGGTSLAAGQRGIELRDTAITHSGVWHAQAAPLILDGGVLSPGVTLTVEPGVFVQMADGAAFHVHGTLIALGTAASPIVITSANASPAPGKWQYIAIDGPGADGTRLDYVQMYYGSRSDGDNAMLSITGGASPSIQNSLFAQASAVGIWADDLSRPAIVSCTFQQLGGAALSIPSADATRVHDNRVAAGVQPIEIRG